MMGFKAFECKDNSDLRRVTRKLVHPIIIGGIIFIILCVFFAMRMDLIPEVRSDVYNTITEYLGKFGQEAISFLKRLKRILISGSEDFCNVIMTFATILGAAVIFFYSVQDSKKEGISHRTIIAYSAGSLGIPVLFLFTLILVPVSYVANILGAYWTTFMCLFWGYVVEILIIGLILMATSFKFSVNVLGNVEIRLFKSMNQLFESHSEAFQKREDLNNYFYSWTYIPHHMEETMKSDELLSDKLVLVRRLLRVPFLKKRIPIRSEIEQFDRKRRCLELQPERLKKNEISRTYEYYYSNLVAVLRQVDSQEKNILDNLYLVLYQFVDEMTKFYDRCVKENTDERENIVNNYLMTVSGIMNAIIFSATEEAVMFCQHVLVRISELDEDECVDIKEVFTKIFGLHVVFYEGIQLLAPENREKYKGRITDNINLKNIIQENNDDFYVKFWEIWMNYTTLTIDNRNQILVEVLKRKRMYMAYLLAGGEGENNED